MKDAGEHLVTDTINFWLESNKESALVLGLWKTE